MSDQEELEELLGFYSADGAARYLSERTGWNIKPIDLDRLIDAGYLGGFFVDVEKTNDWKEYKVADIKALADKLSGNPEEAAKVTEQAKSQYQQKGQRQDQLILSTLESLGYDPLRLPPPHGNKAGAKAEVWKKLRENKKLFASREAFDSAWKRLRRQGGITNRA